MDAFLFYDFLDVRRCFKEKSIDAEKSGELRHFLERDGLRLTQSRPLVPAEAWIRLTQAAGRAARDYGFRRNERTWR